MSIEKEQFEKVMAELRRACLPAGGADAVQAYVDAQAKALFESELFGAVFVRLRDKVLADLFEAVALLRRARGPASIRAVDDDIDAFLARHGQNYGPSAKGGSTLHAVLLEHAPELAALVEPYKGMTLGEGLDAAGQADRAASDKTALGQALDAIAAMPRRQPVTGQAQGAQAGDERAAFDRWSERTDKFHVSGYNPHSDLWEAWQARAALATQPAAGEPVAWITRPLRGSSKGKAVMCQADHTPNLELWEKPFPVYAAPPAAAPVAAGEPVAEFFVEFATLRRAMSIYGLSAPESNHELGSRMERYAIRVIEAVAKLPFPYPPAAAHGDDAVCWVECSERLPESGSPVLAFYTNRAGKGRRIRANYVAPKSHEVDCADPDTQCVEYDEEADCFYLQAGWYELIDNWEEYSSIAVIEGEVSHWVALPAQPAMRAQGDGGEA